MAIPESLKKAMRPITVIVGHYGAGKTNFSVNVAIDAARAGKRVSIVDLDIVNPYFRASEQRRVLEENGVNLVAPVFAEVGSSLDVPSLTGHIVPTLQGAGEDSLVIVDAGGDDAGVTALGRFSGVIEARGYAMLYVANRYRNLVADRRSALENLREIEAASHLRASAIVNNSHLKAETTHGIIVAGAEYATGLAQETGLPLACTTVPAGSATVDVSDAYEVSTYVKTPWE